MASSTISSCKIPSVATTSRTSRIPIAANVAHNVLKPCSIGKKAFSGSIHGLLPLSRPKLSVRQTISTVPRAAQQVQIEVDKPLGLRLTESTSAGGGVVVKSVSGNAAKAGLSPGDTIVYTSSYFGDELWPADNVSFVQSAINACPSPVVLVFVKGANNDINVKRLPNKRAPARFGAARKLTAGQKARASHICLDCGYIYCDETPFAELDGSYGCPQCQAPKKRFSKFDISSGQVTGGNPLQVATLATVIGGLLGIGVLAYIGLSL